MNVGICHAESAVMILYWTLLIVINVRKHSVKSVCPKHIVKMSVIITVHFVRVANHQQPVATVNIRFVKTVVLINVMCVKTVYVKAARCATVILFVPVQIVIENSVIHVAKCNSAEDTNAVR